MMPEAILFDLDDTILSDDIVSEEAWKEACDRFAEKVKACGRESFSPTSYRSDIVLERDGKHIHYEEQSDPVSNTGQAVVISATCQYGVARHQGCVRLPRLGFAGPGNGRW